MDDKIRVSWERTLHPETLKSNIITASIFSMAFEMLKNSIIDRLKSFYTDGFKKGFVVSPEYKTDVLSLNRSPLYASLKWLQNSNAIDENDIEKFEHIKRCRNKLAHEMLSFASSGVDFDVSEAFDGVVSLLKKIELWWFANVELATAPEAYPKNIDINEVVPGPVWGLQMLIDVALGPEEEAMKYYEYFMENADKSNLST